MKKFMKLLSLLLVLVLMMSSLLGCSAGDDEDDSDKKSSKKSSSVTSFVDEDEEEYDGETYKGSYEYKGNKFDVVIVLRDDNTYRRIMKKNGSLHLDEEGEYETTIDEVRLYSPGSSSSDRSNASWTEYKNKNGVLENNGHKFKRQ
ncbi:MAG: hypothetical protein IJF61_03735 [Clostridia bacterium]|nr:hypothetical protein [Clostridia bacterium]